MHSPYLSDHTTSCTANMPSSGSDKTEHGRERCKAAAWAWYERGAVNGSLCRQGSTAHMVRGKYMRSKATGRSTHENNESGSEQLMKASKRSLPPSRFKREAEALVQERRSVQVSADEEVVSNSELGYKTSSSSLTQPSAQYFPMDDPCPSGALSPPPQEDRCWSDKLLGSSSRNNPSSLQYTFDQELDSLILFLGKSATAGVSSQRSSLFDSFELQELVRKLGSNEGDKSEGRRGYMHDHAEAVEAFVPEPKGAAHDHNAQKFHNYERQEVLGPEATTSRNPAKSFTEAENTSISPAEGESGCLNRAIAISESTQSSLPDKHLSTSPPTERHINSCKLMQVENVAEIILGTPVFYRNTPPTPPHNKQTLHDLLQWSPQSPATTPDCHCPSADLSDSDHFYDCESPDINNITINCNSSDRCKNVKAAQHRRRRRPSLLMPHFTHSFSSALHHIPHLPHSFSHALHHLPHSISNVLHHLPHIPNSLSNAFHQIAHLTHSLSSAYKHHSAAHSQEVEASPSNDANVHAHSHHKSFHLRHLFAFKAHHSASHPEIAVCSNSPIIADYRSSPSAPARLIHPKSPSRERRLSASDDYMLIYSSTKKKFSKGIVHYLHHHHYHHHHYVL